MVSSGSSNKALSQSTEMVDPSDATGEPLPIRLTFVFHLENDEWKLVQRHGSFGVRTEEIWPALPFDDIVAAVDTEMLALPQSTAPDGTLTIVFTDIENSTQLNSTFGDRSWVEVLRTHNRSIAEVTGENGGTVVKNSGDGFMLAFPSARRAVSAAVSMQARITETFTDPGSPIKIRIGVHVGEVLNEADDYLGSAVNYAARVAASARGGGIVVSSLVHELLASTGEYAFAEPRAASFKGIENQQTVYPLLWTKDGDKAEGR